jgi:putative Mg2+ transporter-C (MgtC) family protein
MIRPSTMWIEFLGIIPIYLGMGVQILTAVVLGGLVGLDRERKMKSAGIKTNMMICIGSTLYTSISLLNLAGATGMADPNRISAQIVSGIGFLGAGAIIQSRGNIVGLTTAATIWVVAAIGVAIGSGYPGIAIVFTLTILIVLKVLPKLYILLKVQQKFHIEILAQGNVKKSLKQILNMEADKLVDLFEDDGNEKDGDEFLYHAYMLHNPKHIDTLIEDLQDIIHVDKIHHHLVDKFPQKSKF